MPEIDVNIELYCSCGNGLCNQATATHTRNRNEPMFEIEPCQICLDKAEDAGYEKGYAEAERKYNND